MTRSSATRSRASGRLWLWLSAAIVAGLVMVALPAPPLRADGDLLAGDPILSRPTDRGVTVRAIAGRDLVAVVAWRAGDGDWDRTAPVSAAAGEPFDVVLDTLAPDTEYVYRLELRPADSADEPLSADEHRFHTQRPPGAAFTFAVQADPHLDENSNPAVYRQTLRNQLDAAPDFLVDLGDAAMSDRCVIAGDVLCDRTRASSYEQVAARNALMRSYFAQAAHSMPLFMAIGNHEAESGWATGGAAATLAAWSRRARTFHFANPGADGFYSGNGETDDAGAARGNYYAFEWGGALFVVIDPFAYTMRKPTQYTDADMWNWTLGDAQYHWLAETLAASRARFKFVFSHHMTGGGAAEVRGAAAYASLFEWGGRNLDGSWGFASRRPGWEAPVQQLFEQYGVTIWFHGHDHLYAREEVGPVVYQAVPQPSTARYQGPDLAREYGYRATPNETAFVTPGYLRVSVDDAGVRVDLVRTVLADDETGALKNGAVLTSYSVR